MAKALCSGRRRPRRVRVWELNLRPLRAAHPLLSSCSRRQRTRSRNFALAGLTVDFSAALYDEETDLLHVSYLLEASEEGLPKPGPPRGKAGDRDSLGVWHPTGALTNLLHADHTWRSQLMTIYGLNLAHNRWCAREPLA